MIFRKQRNKKSEWVTASEIGIVEICPYQLYLKEQGAKRSTASKKRIDYGNQKHEAFNEAHTRLNPLVFIIIFGFIVIALGLVSLILIWTGVIG